MFGLLLTLLILDALLLSVVVLLQAGQGGGLASLGGGGTAQVLGGRQATTLLTKATWWTGGIFMALSLMLSLVHSRGNAQLTDVQRQLQQQGQPVAPLPASPIQGTTPAPGGPPVTGADSQ
jgi:preprotein translocase subunit SecG